MLARTPSHSASVIGCVALGLCMLCDRPAAEADEAPPNVVTHTYKTVDKLELKVDAYGVDKQHRKPVILWMHGGALILGNRSQITRQLKDRCLRAGYAIVSADYRVAPETKLPQIIEDLADAYRWLHDRGPELLNVDTERIAVAGGSAGGYLTLMTGFRCSPRPAALVSLWGYGDIGADWYAKPSEHYRKQPLVERDAAWSGVKGPPLFDGNVNGKARGRFYLYCRQQGRWTNEVSGFDPVAQSEQLTPYCPVRNVTKQYPPTLMIHGTKDTDVPYEQSLEMHRALDAAGVANQLITVKDAGHGIGDGNRAEVAAAYDAIVPFLDRHVRRQAVKSNP